MEEILTQAFKFIFAMISILNPLGAIPIFLGMTRKANSNEIKSIAKTCSITIFVTLTASLIVGEGILHFFSVSISSFKVGGGILIGTMGFSMLRAETAPTKLNDEEIQKEHINREIGIVPLAIPLMSGPGAITSCIIYAEKIQGYTSWATTMISLVLVSLIIFSILVYSRWIRRSMGSIGINVLTRIMGLILMALAVEFVTSGIKTIFPSLA
jgi:multiple antibiotic resistance protein